MSTFSLAGSITPGVGGIPNGFFKQSYSVVLSSSFGTPPYTYSLVSGALPPGLSLASTGKITGTPSDTGSFGFQIQVIDSGKPRKSTTTSYVVNVSIGLDSYGGLTALPSKAGASGFFRVEKAGGRWTFVTPTGNAFYMRSVYNADYGFVEPAVMKARYNNSTALWATHSLNRMLSYGFNALDIYYSDYTLPVGVYGNKAGASVSVPFVLFYAAGSDVWNNAAMLGLPEPPKDICAGQDAYGYHDYCGITLDAFDPKWQQGNTAELAHDQQLYTGGFASLPWVIGISLGDATYFDTMTGSGGGKSAGVSIGGTGLIKLPTYPHTGFLIATANFQYTGHKDNKLYSKYSWVTYLQQKYGTIQNLNAAWHSNYTTFGDQGGFGTGTGVLDEDGRHTAWFGHDYFNLAAMNANLQADLNAFLYQFTYQAYSVQANTIRTYDKNHLFICGSFGGTGDIGARPQVLQGMRDAGCSVFVWNWNSEYPSNALAVNRAEYDATGTPAVIWYGVSAQADSYWYKYLPPSGGSYDGDYPAQAGRGQQYAGDLASLYSAKGTNGDYYTLGTAFWSLTDSGTGETTNWGLISDRDNAYDGKEATVSGVGTDKWGYPTGGEDRNYGDFIDAVTQTNTNVMKQLIVDQLP